MFAEKKKIITFKLFFRDFQWSVHLPASGDLDDATVLQMHLPRCGMKDVSQTNWLHQGPFYTNHRRKRYTVKSKFDISQKLKLENGYKDLSNLYKGQIVMAR